MQEKETAQYGQAQPEKYRGHELRVRARSYD